ncbi:MAG: hypothetical protein A4E55_02111 [Pelotomaculum sp. PtaU1.Bin035]|nr:MAG: hypothetical protein A4E55_02111 [Pelotomaculum sp. PtaU1.Bin035]
MVSKAKLICPRGGQYDLRDGNGFLMVDKHSDKYQFIDESLTGSPDMMGSCLPGCSSILGLFIMQPHTDDFYNMFFLINFVDYTVLMVYPS